VTKPDQDLRDELVRRLLAGTADLPTSRLGRFGRTASAALDYGCTREFPPPFVEKLARLTRAVHDDDRDALERSFVELGMVRRGRRYDFDTARNLVRAFHGPMLRDEEQTIEMGAAMGLREVYEGKRELLRLALPGEFLFLMRIRFGLMSVLARLGARANWRRLEAGFISGHGMQGAPSGAP